MPNDVTLNIRTRGGRQSAREVDKVGAGVGRLGRRAKRSSGDLRVFTRATTSATGGMRLMAGAAATGGVALVGGLLIGIKRTTDAYNESRKVGAQTNAAIRSTGGVANVTAQHVDRLSASLSRRTATDDEAIQAGANLLLTFKRVRNEVGAGNNVFDRATRSAVDLSAAGFGSIDGAAKQLGKALNDPIKGMTALSRSGVTFTQGQKDRIEGMVEEGNLLGAQRLMLREIESQVGGSAKAQATATDRVKVSWENVQETIGKGLSPAVDAVASDVDKFLVGATPKIERFGSKLGGIFRRNDLSLEDKLKLGSREASRTFGPFVDQAKREIARLDLGTKAGDAFERAVPALGEAAAKAAPVVAARFWDGFMEAGPWAKLFIAGGTIAKVASSVGGTWGVRGPISAGSSSNPIAVVGLGVPGGGPGLPGGKGPKGKKPGKLGKLGNGAKRFGGKALKFGGGVGIASGIAQALGSIDADPFAVFHPQAAGAGDEGAAARRYPNQGRRGPHRSGGRAAAPARRGQPIDVHASFVVGGKELAKIVRRVEADRKARK